jgi:hypothetical protein
MNQTRFILLENGDFIFAKRCKMVFVFPKIQNGILDKPSKNIH